MNIQCYERDIINIGKQIRRADNHVSSESVRPTRRTGRVTNKNCEGQQAAKFPTNTEEKEELMD